MTQEMAQHRVNVNAICPGLVDTERVDYFSTALVPEGESSEEYRACQGRWYLGQLGC